MLQAAESVTSHYLTGALAPAPSNQRGKGDTKIQHISPPSAGKREPSAPRAASTKTSRAGPSHACQVRDRSQALTWTTYPASAGLPSRSHSPRATSRRNAPPILKPLLAHRGNPNYRQAPATEEQTPGTGTPRIVGLRPPTATLRATSHPALARATPARNSRRHNPMLWLPYVTLHRLVLHEVAEDRCFPGPRNLH
jgi:hypothetical protein